MRAKPRIANPTHYVFMDNQGRKVVIPAGTTIADLWKKYSIEGIRFSDSKTLPADGWFVHSDDLEL